MSVATLPARRSATAQTAPTAAQLARARRQIDKVTCSAPWAEHCLAHLAARPKFPKRADHALNQTLVYPPGGTPRPDRRGTLMRRCADCGAVWYPPQYLHAGHLCEDCAAATGVPLTDEKTHVSSTSSPTAIALRDLAYFRVRLIEPRLAAEDEPTLRKQIAAGK